MRFSRPVSVTVVGPSGYSSAGLEVWRMRWGWVARIAAVVIGLFVLLLFLGVMSQVLASSSPLMAILIVVAVVLAILVLVVLVLWSREVKISA